MADNSVCFNVNPIINCMFLITDVVGDDKTTENKKMIIMDCRSYGAAFANRAKGGGVECAGNTMLLFIILKICLHFNKFYN